tara:strand:+ start:629 stop:997 length:369 start_codon:yes stop_codon:yes gene_type:complete
MRYLIIFLLFPTILYADQGLNISCVNMKNLLDKNPRIHKFKFDVLTFQYFDQNKNLYVEVPNDKMIIKEDFFAARFPEYELGFQINVFEDKKKPVMSMSKYDYKNDKFLEHYYCDVQVASIN